jgi:hypothetical protein
LILCWIACCKHEAFTTKGLSQCIFIIAQIGFCVKIYTNKFSFEFCHIVEFCLILRWKVGKVFHKILHFFYFHVLIYSCNKYFKYCSK